MVVNMDYKKSSKGKNTSSYIEKNTTSRSYKEKNAISRNSKEGY